jgi:HAD superfamily phosphatase (TIGR01668 family)
LLQFRPALRAEAVTEITAGFLAARGIRALVLDLDNTLVPWHGREVKPEVEAWLKSLQAAQIGLCIVSNTHRPHRLKELAAVLGVQYGPSGGKPRRGGFYRAMQAMGTRADETAVVGDQVMTDIWGGNRCGLLTILVEPLSPVEFIGTRVVSRNVERLLLRFLEKQGHASEAVSDFIEPE